MDSANEIITRAIDALRGEAQTVAAKIAALENSLSLEGDVTPAKTSSRGRPKKLTPHTELPAPKKRAHKAKEAPATAVAPSAKDTAQTPVEKRAKSWDAAKKAAAAEQRMRKYWASRKKEA